MCDGPLPPPRTSHSAVIDGDALLVYGGQNSVLVGGILADCHLLDLRAQRWQAVAPTEPQPLPTLCRHGAAVVEGQMWLHGGYDGAGRVGTTYVVRSSSDPPQPRPERGAAAAASAPASQEAWTAERPLTLADLPELEVAAVREQPRMLISLLHRRAVERGLDAYIDPATGYSVFTRLYLQRRECCGNKCRHCPWGHRNVVRAPKPPVDDW